MGSVTNPRASIEIALAPIPSVMLQRGSRRLGVELYLKRDDLTGLLESGNKIRKLEFLAGDALAQGADTLITIGTLQSNCCRAAPAVAAPLRPRATVPPTGAPPGTYGAHLPLRRMPSPRGPHPTAGPVPPPPAT